MRAQRELESLNDVKVLIKQLHKGKDISITESKDVRSHYDLFLKDSDKGLYIEVKERMGGIKK